MLRTFVHGAIGRQSIPHGGPIELFLIPASVPRLVTNLWYGIFCLWGSAYKRNLAANRKV